MIGHALDRIFTPADRGTGRLESERRLAVLNGRADDERWHLRKDGSRFWASSAMTPLRDGTDEHLGFVTVIRDRTAERQSVDAIRETEARLRESEDHFR